MGLNAVVTPILAPLLLPWIVGRGQGEPARKGADAKNSINRRQGDGAAELVF